MGQKEQELYLIDGSAYIYRAYHAMGPLSNSQGSPTGAIFGFTNMIVKTLKDRSPQRIAVVFDAKGPTFRHEMFPEYKANRPAPPQDLIEQIPRIHELVEAYSIPVISMQGYEADDIIATLARQANQRGWKVTIVSGDKDLTQLVNGNSVMWDPQKDFLYDEHGVKEKFGIRPSEVIDFMALTGDTSDNVPGIPGIGPKTASGLIENFKTLEGIYANIENIKQKKVRENLKEHKEKAILSRRLVTLHSDVPIDVKLDDLIPGAPNFSKLRALFKEFEFRRMLVDLPAEQTLDFSNYKAITEIAELEKLLDELSLKKIFAIDVETTSLEPVRAELVGISVCAEAGMGCYIPVGHREGKQLEKSHVLKLFGPLLENEAIGKIGQNIKYDLIVLEREGASIKGLAFDTMLASYILDPTRRGHSLDDLAELYLEHKTIPIKDLIGVGKSQIQFSEVTIEDATNYSCEDADVTYRVAEILRPRVSQEGLSDLYEKLEMPLIRVLAEMEMTGVKVDVDYLAVLSTEFSAQLELLETQIYEIAGEKFNINSTQQLGEILFTKLGLKATKKTKTGLSTALNVLEELASEHELPRKILDYRSIFKLKSTYVDSLTNLVNPSTGRIHTSYNQAVAATGRLSSSDPNLQNIPIRSAEGRKIRRAFIADEGKVFVAADYSQIELRVMAHLSGDARLREAFELGEDIHAITAASIFDCAPALVTPEMRRKAKEINFGIIYGMGPFKLASQIGVGLKMAKQYLEEYYQTYSGVKRYMEEVPEKAASTGFVTTVLGRRRPMPDLKSSNKVLQQAARRVAINTTIQGSAADLIKMAMIRVNDAIKKSGAPCKMILQVHDELVLETDEKNVEETSIMLKTEMENAYKLSVPLLVDVSSGKNWEQAH